MKLQLGVELRFLQCVEERLRKESISRMIKREQWGDTKIKLKMKYNNDIANGRLNGQDWYCLQAFRALNQALGRCIRHKDDYGAIVLLDARYRNPVNTHHISNWLQSSLRCYNDFATPMDQLRTFFQDLYWDKLFVEAVVAQEEAVAQEPAVAQEEAVAQEPAVVAQEAGDDWLHQSQNEDHEEFDDDEDEEYDDYGDMHDYFTDW